MLRVEVTELEPERSMPALVARDFDLIMGEEYRGHSQVRRREIECHHLAHDQLRLVVPGRWSECSLNQLAEHPWVMEPIGTSAREWAAATCRATRFEPDIRYTSTDLLLHLSLVEDRSRCSDTPADLPVEPDDGVEREQPLHDAGPQPGRHPAAVMFQAELVLQCPDDRLDVQMIASMRCRSQFGKYRGFWSLRAGRISEGQAGTGEELLGALAGQALTAA